MAVGISIRKAWTPVHSFHFASMDAPPAWGGGKLAPHALHRRSDALFPFRKPSSVQGPTPRPPIPETSGFPTTRVAQAEIVGFFFFFLRRGGWVRPGILKRDRHLVKKSRFLGGGKWERQGGLLGCCGMLRLIGDGDDLMETVASAKVCGGDGIPVLVRGRPQC